MIFGMSTFTFVHVVLSLIGIGSGLVVVFAMVGAKNLAGWTALFLATTILTSVTGFLLPSGGQLLPSHILGIVSLVVLAVACLALYRYRLVGPWRWLYVAGAVLALYLNVFVGIVQAFQKIPALQAVAPTQSEPPFLATQLVALAIFIVLGVLGVKRFHAGQPAMA